MRLSTRIVISALFLAWVVYEFATGAALGAWLQGLGLWIDAAGAYWLARALMAKAVKEAGVDRFVADFAEHKGRSTPAGIKEPRAWRLVRPLVNVIFDVPRFTKDIRAWEAAKQAHADGVADPGRYERLIHRTEIGEAVIGVALLVLGFCLQVVGSLIANGSNRPGSGSTGAGSSWSDPEVLAAVITFVGLYIVTQAQWKKERIDRRAREDRERAERLERRFRFEFAKWAAAVQRYLIAQRYHAESLHKQHAGLRPLADYAERRKRGVVEARFLMRAASVRLHAFKHDQQFRDWARGVELRASVDTGTDDSTTAWFNRIEAERTKIDAAITEKIDALPPIEAVVAAR